MCKKKQLNKNVIETPKALFKQKKIRSNIRTSLIFGILFEINDFRVIQPPTKQNTRQK